MRGTAWCQLMIFLTLPTPISSAPTASVAPEPAAGTWHPRSWSQRSNTRTGWTDVCGEAWRQLLSPRPPPPSVCRCDHRTKHMAHKVVHGTKRVLQRWYYQRWLVPAGDPEDTILCDVGSNCRHYLYNRSRVIGVKLGAEVRAFQRECPADIQPHQVHRSVCPTPSILQRNHT